MKRVPIEGTSIELEYMIFGETLTERTPLVIMSPIELPIPPSAAFCDTLWEAGYQVVFLRRPGFGRAPDLPETLLSRKSVQNGAGLAAEAAVFRVLVDQLDLDRYVLMGLGTANSICYRLSQLTTKIDLTIYANPLFHPAIWDVIKPPWLRRMIRQTVLTRSGMQIAVRGLRAVLRRDPIWFYTQFAQKSAGDLAYIKQNESDFIRAAIFLQAMRPETYFYNLQSALVEDTVWNPKITEKMNGVILSGSETIKSWKKEIRAEATRLGMPIVFAPAGDLFVPYVSVDTLLHVLDEQASIVAPRVNLAE